MTAEVTSKICMRLFPLNMNLNKIGVEAWAWQELFVKALMTATVARVSTTLATSITSDQLAFSFH